jgi:hypothetical protein
VPLGPLCDLAEYAIEIGAGLFGPDLAGHVDETPRLFGIVGRRFGLARHAPMMDPKRSFVIEAARVAAIGSTSPQELQRLGQQYLRRHSGMSQDAEAESQKGGRPIYRRLIEFLRLRSWKKDQENLP